MRKPDLNATIYPLSDPDYVLRTAAQRLMDYPGHAAGYSYPFESLDRVFNAISTLRHEGQEAVGSIILAPKGHGDIETAVQFSRPVRLNDYGAVRKMLQMCDGSLSLLCGGGEVYGIGRLLPDHQLAKGEVFTIRFVTQFVWELWHADQLMMVVRYGRPTSRPHALAVDIFIHTARSTLPDVGEVDVQRLAVLVRQIVSLPHGCMVVVSADAAAEAGRLSCESTPVVPFRLDGRTLPLVTAIDGAVLIDTHGDCHAIGVIVDGKASPQGSPARGSRYNSAVRYVTTRRIDRPDSPCLVIVKSEDGMLSVLPPDLPQDALPASSTGIGGTACGG